MLLFMIVTKMLRMNLKRVTTFLEELKFIDNKINIEDSLKINL